METERGISPEGASKDIKYFMPSSESAIERTASGLLPVTLNLVVTPSGYVTAYKNGEIYKNDAGETTIKCVVELYNLETV